MEDLAALAESRQLQVRFIEMMPIGYGAAMPCISGPELRERFARRWPEFSPLPAAQSAGFGDGPAVYYTVPGWKGDVGFIAAVHGKFCAEPETEEPPELPKEKGNAGGLVLDRKSVV